MNSVMSKAFVMFKSIRFAKLPEQNVAYVRRVHILERTK